MCNIHKMNQFEGKNLAFSSRLGIGSQVIKNSFFSIGKNLPPWWEFANFPLKAEVLQKSFSNYVSRYGAMTLTIVAFVGLVLFGPESLALGNDDKLAELDTLTTEVGKLTKNGCFIAGGISSLVGLAWSIAAQNLKILAASTVITLFAFKAPALFTVAMLI